MTIMTRPYVLRYAQLGTGAKIHSHFLADWYWCTFIARLCNLVNVVIVIIPA
jgi:hypothetical protein